jgi:hypothetical protein
MLWEVRPIEKKCVYTRTTYYVPDDSEIAAGKKFYMDEMYRWGRCIIRSDVKPEQHAEDPYGNPFELSDYDIEDQESDDGCSLDFEFEDDDDWTEEERAYIEDLWEEDSWSAFEDNGIYMDEHDTQYVGPLEVTCVDETPVPVAPKSTNGWPF